MKLFAKIRAGEVYEFKGLRQDQIHRLVQEKMNELVERTALFDEIIVEEP